jgi:hypothetical protein
MVTMLLCDFPLVPFFALSKEISRHFFHHQHLSGPTPSAIVSSSILMTPWKNEMLGDGFSCNGWGGWGMWSHVRLI